jgi:hypothetical protein
MMREPAAVANKRVQTDLPALSTAWSTMANGRC